MNIKKIYIRLIDGTIVLVPTEVQQITESEFKILENEDLDLETDATAIWEFFPGDTVKCKWDSERNLMVADELISSDFPNRRMHELIFKIVEGLGKLKLEDIKAFESEIKPLKNPSCTILQKKHPMVKRWIEGSISDKNSV